jgi:hypothetical protein
MQLKRFSHKLSLACLIGLLGCTEETQEAQESDLRTGFPTRELYAKRMLESFSGTLILKNTTTDTLLQVTVNAGAEHSLNGSKDFAFALLYPGARVRVSGKNAQWGSDPLTKDESYGQINANCKPGNPLKPDGRWRESENTLVIGGPAVGTTCDLGR